MHDSICTIYTLQTFPRALDRGQVNMNVYSFVSVQLNYWWPKIFDMAHGS
jgi:hypothetical protein